MSVILQACRHSKQKSIEKALKKKAEKKRLKRESQMDALNAQIGALPTESPAAKIWTFLVEGTPYSVVYYKDTLDVFCNGDQVEVLSSFTDTGANVDFTVGCHKARIITSSSGNCKEGMIHSLTLDGNQVPE
ncbi:hypothetical protein ScPMuIL_018788 [Solemya velum]